MASRVIGSNHLSKERNDWKRRSGRWPRISKRYSPKPKVVASTSKSCARSSPKRRRDADAVDEEQALLDVYRRALGMLADLPLGRSAVKEKFGEVDADQDAMEPVDA